MRTVLIRVLLGASLITSAVPARADATVFVGAMTAGSPRPALGISVGRCPSIVGFEIEYASTLGGDTPVSSRTVGINANLMVQSRRPIHGLQPFGIAGFGLYGETYGSSGGSGEVSATGIGGGAKIGLRGPLKLRLDYRVFLLGDAPDAARGIIIHQHPQRFSVGLSLAF